MKQAMLTLVLLAVVAVTSAARTAGGPPTNASPQEFCAQVDAFYAGLDRAAGSAGSVSDREVAGMVKEVAERLARVGTPGDIPTDARRGFEVTLASIRALPGDASAADVDAIDSGLGPDQRRETQAFDVYLALTCGTSTNAVAGPV